MMRSARVKNSALCAMFAALISVGAFIKIPMPIMSFTLQILFTTLAGLLLGSKKGAISVGIYIITGLSGVPVFSEGGGLFYILKPSFGYILGFMLGAYVTGKIVEQASDPSYLRLSSAAFAGLCVIYLLGLAYFILISRYYLGSEVNLHSFIIYYIIPDLAGDITLCVLSVLLAKRLIPVIKGVK